ncbi:MAG: PadR family transcriptional regulator [Vicinamibacterales bacterium]
MSTQIGVFELLVLMAVAAGGDEAYGVSIRQAVEAGRGREVSSGAVHTTLDRLERRGLVTSRTAGGPPSRGGRPRRYYRLTPPGEAAVRDNYGALSHLAGRLPVKVSS